MIHLASYRQGQCPIGQPVPSLGSRKVWKFENVLLLNFSKSKKSKGNLDSTSLEGSDVGAGI